MDAFKTRARKRLWLSGLGGPAGEPSCSSERNTLGAGWESSPIIHSELPFLEAVVEEEEAAAEAEAEAAAEAEKRAPRFVGTPPQEAWRL